MLRGVSVQKDADIVLNAARACSDELLEKILYGMSAQKLADFQKRSMADLTLFEVFLDTIHLGNEALGVDRSGEKMALGF